MSSLTLKVMSSIKENSMRELGLQNFFRDTMNPYLRQWRKRVNNAKVLTLIGKSRITRKGPSLSDTDELEFEYGRESKYNELLYYGTISLSFNNHDLDISHNITDRYDLFTYDQRSLEYLKEICDNEKTIIRTEYFFGD